MNSNTFNNNNNRQVDRLNPQPQGRNNGHNTSNTGHSQGIVTTGGFNNNNNIQGSFSSNHHRTPANPLGGGPTSNATTNKQATYHQVPSNDVGPHRQARAKNHNDENRLLSMNDGSVPFTGAGQVKRQGAAQGGQQQQQQNQLPPHQDSAHHLAAPTFKGNAGNDTLDTNLTFNNNAEFTTENNNDNGNNNNNNNNNNNSNKRLLLQQQQRRQEQTGSNVDPVIRDLVLKSKEQAHEELEKLTQQRESLRNEIEQVQGAIKDSQGIVNDCESLFNRTKIEHFETVLLEKRKELTKLKEKRDQLQHSMVELENSINKCQEKIRQIDRFLAPKNENASSSETLLHDTSTHHHDNFASSSSSSSNNNNDNNNNSCFKNDDDIPPPSSNSNNHNHNIHQSTDNAMMMTNNRPAMASDNQVGSLKNTSNVRHDSSHNNNNNSNNNQRESHQHQQSSPPDDTTRVLKIVVDGSKWLGAVKKYNPLASLIKLLSTASIEFIRSKYSHKYKKPVRVVVPRSGCIVLLNDPETMRNDGMKKKIQEFARELNVAGFTCKFVSPCQNDDVWNVSPEALKDAVDKMASSSSDGLTLTDIIIVTGDDKHLSVLQHQSHSEIRHAFINNTYSTTELQEWGKEDIRSLCLFPSAPALEGRFWKAKKLENKIGEIQRKFSELRLTVPPPLYQTQYEKTDDDFFFQSIYHYCRLNYLLTRHEQLKNALGRNNIMSTRPASNNNNNSRRREREEKEDETSTNELRRQKKKYDDHDDDSDGDYIYPKENDQEGQQQQQPSSISLNNNNSLHSEHHSGDQNNSAARRLRMQT